MSQFAEKMFVIFLLSCSEIEEGSPSEEVVETEETQEVVATDGENRSVSHSCRKYLVVVTQYLVLLCAGFMNVCFL